MIYILRLGSFLDASILYLTSKLLNISFVRGGGKKNGKGKKGHKKGKKEGYDLIVNINLEDWKLSPEQVNIFQGSLIA